MIRFDNTYGFDNPVTAWSTYGRYVEECDRGLVHSEAWIAKMEALEKELRSCQDDLRIINTVDAARGRPSDV